MIIMDELLTPEDVARILRITEENVRTKLKSGEIKGFKLGRGAKGRWKIRQEELKRYIEDQEFQSSSQDK